jgi:hypothetical protein
MKTDTKKEYEREVLNQIEVPFHDCKSNGGRIPDNAKYGSWLRRNDPIAFRIGFNEWAAENRELHARYEAAQ